MQRVSGPEPSVFDQPIDFPVTNINVCFLQQASVFRDWWVVAESRRPRWPEKQVDSSGERPKCYPAVDTMC